METATITEDVNAEIMDNAFAGCLSLKYIYFKGRKIFKFTGFTQHNVNADLKIVVNDDIYQKWTDINKDPYVISQTRLNELGQTAKFSYKYAQALKLLEKAADCVAYGKNPNLAAILNRVVETLSAVITEKQKRQNSHIAK